MFAILNYGTSFSKKLHMFRRYGVVDCLSESNQRVNEEPYQWSKLNQFGRIWLENSPRGLNPTSSALNACVTLGQFLSIRKVHILCIF